MSLVRFASIVALALVLFTTRAIAQSPLPTSVASGATTRDTPTTYAFAAPAAGLLTIVLRGGTVDLRLTVTDADGQVIEQSDSDIGGQVSAEQLSVHIDGPGRYTITVDSYGERGDFKIGSTFLAFPELARPPDGDGAPTRASVLEPNKNVTDSIDPSQNDPRDWFVLTAPSAGTLTVVTRGTGEAGNRGESNDLVLEAFKQPDFRESLDRSDRDSQGNGANEAVSVTARANERIYIRVSAPWADARATPYRLTTSFIPD